VVEGIRYPVSAIMDGKDETLAIEGPMDCVPVRIRSVVCALHI